LEKKRKRENVRGVDRGRELNRGTSEADHWCMVFFRPRAKFLTREPYIASALKIVVCAIDLWRRRQM